MSLFISNFSRTLPPTFIRFHSLYLDASCTFSLPGLTIGNILVLFHLLGKHPVCRHALYILYVNEGAACRIFCRFLACFRLLQETFNF